MKKVLLTALLLVSTISFAKEPTPAPAGTVILTSDNHINLNVAIDSESAAKVMQQAQVLDSKLPSSEPLYLVLYTPGGSIQAGLEMITFLKNLNRPVHTITIFAASMGFQTVQGLGDRLILPYGTLMSHKAAGGFEGEFPGQIDSRYVFWLNRINALDQQTVSRTNGKLTLEKYRAMYENEWWADGQKTVDVGLADRVITPRCDHSLSNGAAEESLTFKGFDIVIKTSKCPLNTGILEVSAAVHTNKGKMSLDDFLKQGGDLSGSSSSSFYSYDTTTKQAALYTTTSIDIEEINKKLKEVREQRINNNKKVVRSY